MNKIKASFSHIKATDRFKDKLEKELLNNNNNLKLKTNLYKSKINHKISITAAAIFLIILGGIGYNLQIRNLRDTISDSSTVSPIEKSSKSNEYAFEDGNNTYKKEDNQYDKDIISQSATNDKKIINNSEIETTPKVKKSTESIVADKDSTLGSTNDVINPKQEVKPAIDNINDNNLYSSARIMSTNSIYIPKIELPNSSSNINFKMVPLIVYKDKIYTYAPIEIAPENAKNFIGKKLGTTKSNINEWSTQSEYSTEFASNIGITDVYSVNGYAEDFRIMTNLTLENGTNYPEFYECLNGITISSGEDFFGKFKLQGNIASAEFQTFTDWNNGTATFYSISDINLLSSFIENLNKSIPILSEDIEPLLGDYRNDNEFRNITFNLKDGCKNVTFTVLKSGYVYYGYPGVYFKIDTKFTKELWDKLEIKKTN